MDDVALFENRQALARARDMAQADGLPTRPETAVSTFAQSVSELGSQLSIHQREYLLALAVIGYKHRAMSVASVTHPTVGGWRKTSPLFASMEKQALALLVEHLEQIADQRAMVGWDEPVYGTLGRPEMIEVVNKNGDTELREVVQKYTGLVGYKKVYDHKLLAMRLAALDPEQYTRRQKTELTGPGGGPIQVQPVIDTLKEKFAALKAQRDAEVVSDGPADT